MKTQIKKLKGYVSHVTKSVAEIVKEVHDGRKYPYEISGWLDKGQKEKDILVYRINATDKYVSSFSVLEIYNDDAILTNFSPKEVKYIATLAICIHYKTDAKYRLVWKKFRDSVGGSMVYITDRDSPGVIKINTSDLEKNIAIIVQMNGKDAYFLGKEAGIAERLTEEKLLKAQQNQLNVLIR